MAPSDSRQTPAAQYKARLVTEDLEKPLLDDRSYRVMELANGMEVLLDHDPKADKASASMDMNVGNFSDEADMPGMAHAVEHVSSGHLYPMPAVTAVLCPPHLVFRSILCRRNPAPPYGTKKYPGENDYSQYLSSNLGHSNAYMASTSTNYYFNISTKPADDENLSKSNPLPLLSALNCFSQFFVEPLFLESTLDYELKAVDLENKKNLQNDSWRLYYKLNEALHARGESLDLLKCVIELFTPVPNKNLLINRWDNEAPLRPNELSMLYFMKLVIDLRELNLYFLFLNKEDMYMSQLSKYVSHLINHERPGSIMSYIKAKGWANGFSMGTYSVCPGTPGIFDCQIELTEEV
ncbi:hypothetical protein jhhlp_007969 [Lomentospora prolificans]|uniref:Peptidase M16 N-terminal domain-containing protein n=1 Tax=Lomentospora prolificans TaxID=41688 RepID=A0A2N3MZU0_9PEZI|nr:hypothetical protein jhhlp_007969 [Lomentospora prolificans]